MEYFISITMCQEFELKSKKNNSGADSNVEIVETKDNETPDKHPVWSFDTVDVALSVPCSLFPVHAGQRDRANA
uniref:hypothetical protein n=1 Tax=Marinobacterium profundum TaxID=1714300 RepID=UPI0013158B94|nr:hypothetical protein [Marinobacterium profundum]